MKRVNRLLGKLLFLFPPIIFLISCNNSDKNTAKNAHQVDTVVIKQMQFNPAELNVNIGDTVVWINRDMVDHNVTEDKSNGFYSDTIAVGKSWKHVVTDTAGYFCSLHPSMRGQLVLK